MNKNKIRRLRRKLAKLRSKARGGIPSVELERFAESLGRREAKRGDHPTYISDLLPDARPVSIPHHSRPLNPFTAGSILDDLELDLDKLEEIYGED
jgi:hypothetical protein